ncbi:hypothetical protein [Parvularcula sp. LCG005]|uniref:hypothetical protein n=1 Tax=Parvularcula sp. LCG005 TaxID=3078805 RepID=UPI002942BF05|nr:hypothetical protein [Parvularcula sp. LCG005]WOI54289.1 hypothetical protein RUI03_04635 [Parvularcula sp. LCG005]
MLRLWPVALPAVLSLVFAGWIAFLRGEVDQLAANAALLTHERDVARAQRDYAQNAQMALWAGATKRLEVTARNEARSVVRERIIKEELSHDEMLERCGRMVWPDAVLDCLFDGPCGDTPAAPGPAGSGLAGGL